MFLLAGNVSSFSFAPGGVLNDAGKAEARDTVLAAGMLMIVGFGTKAGMFPLHGWLPTAHPVAPAPASAVLSGIITKSGVLGVYRVVYELIGAETLRGSWVQIVFLALTMFTVFSGSLLAYKEQLLKKRLAYSSVSQVSYVLFGLATMTAPGVIGALLHVCAHSLIKDTLFMSAGAIIHRTGKTRVEELEGIGKRMPKVMTCFTAVSLGLVGIPPCLGFVSKWYLAQGSLAAAGIPEWLTWLGPAVLLVSALLTAGYLLSIVIRGFFPSREIPEESLTKCDPGASMWIPMACFALLSVALGVFPGKLIALFSSIAASVL
jgi:multicomponent Na+:H+ antiporter subunit D